MNDHPGCFGLAIIALAALSLLMHGCGASPMQAQSIGLAVAADLTSGAEDVIDVAVRADLHNTCPDLADGCVTTVRANWAPIDTAVNAVVTTLHEWSAALDLARIAGIDPGAAVGRALRLFVEAYTALRASLASVHIEIPPLPPDVATLLTALAGAAS